MFRSVAPLLLLASLLTACNSLPIVDVPAKSQSGRVRYLVIHHTTSGFASALNELTRNAVSAHYLLPESQDPSYPHDELQVYRLVDENARAWHAGVSQWNGDHKLNDTSIGIELTYRTRCNSLAETPERDGLNLETSPQHICFMPDYDPQQIALLVTLAKDILARHPDILPHHVIGHSDIAPDRKIDPGARFPWQYLAKQGVGVWYDETLVAKHYRVLSPRTLDIAAMQSALQAWGYGLTVTGTLDAATRNVLTAFQQHFHPSRVSGEADPKSIAILLALLEKQQPEKFRQWQQQYPEALAPPS